jgi:nitrogen fixation/metabolism regulation signal transduction histidine kinase
VAEGGLGEFTQLLIIGASIFVVLIAFAAVAWSTAMFGPIREMSERLGSGERRTDSLEVPERSPVEFQQLTVHFQHMMQALDTHRTEHKRSRSRH